jgi:hypothetical protein
MNWEFSKQLNSYKTFTGYLHVTFGVDVQNLSDHHEEIIKSVKSMSFPDDGD